MTTDKSNMLCILQVLQERTDENHILSMSEIIAEIKQRHDRTLDRRTVTAAIAALKDFGYEISTYAENRKGYYLFDRVFTAGEIKLLTDAVYSCKYISKRQTEDILEKLRSFMSDYEKARFKYTNIVSADKKSPNPEVFMNIEVLDQAISEKKMISFVYLDYDYDKKLKPKRESRYVASPYMMLCDDSHYYLALIYQQKDSPAFYRIDMMKDIRILDKPVEKTKKEANLENTTKVVFAHTGKPVRTRLHCKKSILRYVIEEFGNDINITKLEDGTFYADFLTSEEGLAIWALKYLRDAEVIEPASVREKVIAALSDNMYTE